MHNRHYPASDVWIPLHPARSTRRPVAAADRGHRLPTRDWRNVKPVSAQVFEAWRSLYAFDHVDLKARVESVNDSSPERRLEKVSYAAAYGNERIPAYLFLPKNAAPPYQVMVGFSGGNVFFERSSATTPTSIDSPSSCEAGARSYIRSTRARSSGPMTSRPMF